jgi:hypothetical protein
MKAENWFRLINASAIGYCAYSFTLFYALEGLYFVDYLGLAVVFIVNLFLINKIGGKNGVKRGNTK